MKDYTLQAIGTKQVLISNISNKNHSFKDFQEISTYIKKHNLENEIEGIEKIPAVYGLKIGYQPPFKWLTASYDEKINHHAAPIKEDRIEEVLMQSGFTNPVLIN